MGSSRRMLEKEFRDREARADYAEIFLNSNIALQIKILRQQRGWTQGELADRAGLHQSQISGMEQVSHTVWKVGTLKKLARAFDLALTVRFESFGRFLDDLDSANRGALERHSFDDDPRFRDDRAGLEGGFSASASVIGQLVQPAATASHGETTMPRSIFVDPNLESGTDSFRDTYFFNPTSSSRSDAWPILTLES